MAVDNFINIANIRGYIGSDTDPTVILTEPVDTLLVDGLTVTKSADKNTWTTGILTYTITIDNQSGSDYNNVTITDQLGLSEDDSVWVALIENSVMMGENPVDYTYVEETGFLTITPATALNITTGQSVEFTFQVEKQVPPNPTP